MVSAWVYDHKYMNEDFDYNDLEKQYLENESKSAETPQSLKEQLDQAHKWTNEQKLLHTFSFHSEIVI